MSDYVAFHQMRPIDQMSVNILEHTQTKAAKHLPIFVYLLIRILQYKQWVRWFEQYADGTIEVWKAEDDTLSACWQKLL